MEHMLLNKVHETENGLCSTRMSLNRQDPNFHKNRHRYLKLKLLHDFYRTESTQIGLEMTKSSVCDHLHHFQPSSPIRTTERNTKDEVDRSINLFSLHRDDFDLMKPMSFKSSQLFEKFMDKYKISNSIQLTKITVNSEKIVATKHKIRQIQLDLLRSTQNLSQVLLSSCDILSRIIFEFKRCQETSRSTTFHTYFSMLIENMDLKTKLLKLETSSMVYNPDIVAKLYSIKQRLSKESTDFRSHISLTTSKLQQYWQINCCPDFQSIVAEYTKICREIEGVANDLRLLH